MIATTESDLGLTVEDAVDKDCETPFRLEHLVKTDIPVTLMCGRVERGVGAGEGCCMECSGNSVVNQYETRTTLAPPTTQI